MSDGSWWPESDDDGTGESASRPHRPPREPAPEVKPASRRIHILGLEHPGKFLAYSMLKFPEAPAVSLLTQNQAAFRAWQKADRGITLSKYGSSETRYGCDLELLRPTIGSEPYLSESAGNRGASGGDRISQIVINTKSIAALRALTSIRHRLDHHSTILFVHNSLGIIEDVNETLFPDPATRPNYMLGVIPRTVIPATAYFNISLEGLGPSFFTIVPRQVMSAPDGPFKGIVRDAPSAAYLLRTLTRCPELMATGLPFLDLLNLKLEKLAVRAVIDPLATILECNNGQLLHNNGVSATIRLLLDEISDVFRSLSELRSLPTTSKLFDPERLRKLTTSILLQTSGERSLMLRDIEAGRVTDIDYINGYVWSKGRRLGIHCPVNCSMVQLVKAKRRIGLDQRMRHVPFDIN